MRKRKIAFIIMTLVTIALVASLTWFAFQPPPGRPEMSITFVGYTNDTAGNQLARFTVTNKSSSAVYRQPYYFIQVVAPTEPSGWTGYQPRTPIPGKTVLHAGASETFGIPLPTNQSPWRLYLHVYPDTMPVRVVKQSVSDSLRTLGLKPRYQVVYYNFFSDRIE